MPIVTRWKRINNYLDRRDEPVDPALYLDEDRGGMSCRVYRTSSIDDPGFEVYGFWVLERGSLVLHVRDGENFLPIEDGPDVEDRFGGLALSIANRG